MNHTDTSRSTVHTQQNHQQLCLLVAWISVTNDVIRESLPHLNSTLHITLHHSTNQQTTAYYFTPQNCKTPTENEAWYHLERHQTLHNATTYEIVKISNRHYSTTYYLALHDITRKDRKEQQITQHNTSILTFQLRLVVNPSRHQLPVKQITENVQIYTL